MDAWNILVVVVLALILLLILPMVAARNGTKSFTQALMAPLHRKKKRGPLGLEVEPDFEPGLRRVETRPAGLGCGLRRVRSGSCRIRI